MGRKCAYCGKTNVPLEVEHIVPKSRGGTERVSNLAISCYECNLLKGKRTAEEFGHPEVEEQAEELLKAVAFMNNVRWRLVERLDCRYTYGYVTKHDRVKLGLEKSNINDAFVIAGGKHQRRVKPFRMRQVRRNNRAFQKNRKGYGVSIRRKRYRLQPNDLVYFEGKEHVVKGVFNYGKWIRLTDLKGNVVNANMKSVELIKYGQGLQFN